MNVLIIPTTVMPMQPALTLTVALPVHVMADSLEMVYLQALDVQVNKDDLGFCLASYDLVINGSCVSPAISFHYWK